MSAFTEVHRPPVTVVGVEVRTDNESEMKGAGKIGGLWRTFADKRAELIPFGIAEDTLPVAVYHDYDGDHTAPYTLLIGVEWPLETAPPPGWVKREFAASLSHVWTAQGDMPDAVIDAWQTIWTYYEKANDRRRSFEADLERYTPDGLEIHLGVAPVMLP